MFCKNNIKHIKKTALITLNLLMILLFSNYATAQAKQITMLTHNLAGQAECRDYICRGKVHTGKRSFYIELINALTNRLKYDNKIKEVPQLAEMIFNRRPGGQKLKSPIKRHCCA